MMRTISIWMTGHDLGKYRPGLGPNAWGYWRLLIPFQGLFFVFTELHDLGYSFGKTELDKLEYDEQLFQDCLDASGKNIFAIFFSVVYYMAVAKFGSPYFQYS